jgi:hypothetical protein
MNDYVLEGIAKLQSLDNPVVHCRIDEDGVLVDRELGVPVITRFDRSIYLKNLFDNSELHRYIYEIDYGDITATAGNYVSLELYLLSYIVHNIISVSLQTVPVEGYRCCRRRRRAGIVECVYFIRTNRRLFNANV